MGLIDVRRYSVTTYVDGPGELVVGDVELADESEWDINRVQLVSSERVGHAPSVYWPCAVPG